MTELKPCPFCGGEPVLFESHFSGIFYVVCKDCGLTAPHRLTKEKAMNVWNLAIFLNEQK